jgi:medium-chain acyl-[acyl-carrier-protein] hydrolase
MTEQVAPAKRATPPSRWFPHHRGGDGAALRLFCFPYAGGTAAAFRDWTGALGPDVEVLAIQYPGRGARLFEGPMRRMDALVRATVAAMLPLLDRPFAFFGYSMGALAAFEAARLLRARHGTGPSKLLVGACRDPRAMHDQVRRHDLPLPQLIVELQKLNGTPPEILGDPEALECFLPALRADFEVVETYSYRPEAPLACPIRGFGGFADEVSPAELALWGRETAGGFAMEMLEGDHFFIQQSSERLLELVARELGVAEERERSLASAGIAG